MLRVGTDCSGIEAPIQALIQLKIPFRHVFACDSDKYVRASINANYHPELFYTDITNRDHTKLPDMDLYIAGFPCQSFSEAGDRKGTTVPRGNIMYDCLDTIQTKRPTIAILENVVGFTRWDNGSIHRDLISRLTKMGYHVEWEILDTQDYGLPQRRKRMYLVATIGHQNLPIFPLPKKPMLSLENILEIHSSTESDAPSLLNAINTSILSPYDKKKVTRKMNRYMRNKTIMNELVLAHTMPNGAFSRVCPTITTNLRYWLAGCDTNRILTIPELVKLQGFPSDFKQVVSDTQFRKQIGNAMSVNVLVSLFEKMKLVNHFHKQNLS